MIRRRGTAIALMLPASALVLVFLALPLLLLFRYSLNRFVPGQFMVEALTLDNYVKVVTDPYYAGVLKTTLLMATGVTLRGKLKGDMESSAILLIGSQVGRDTPILAI